MNTTRTTVLLPTDLYEKLKAAAFYQRKTITQLIQEGVSQVVSYKKNPPGSGILALKGKYKIKNKGFNRAQFYDGLLKRKMSI